MKIRHKTSIKCLYLFLFFCSNTLWSMQTYLYHEDLFSVEVVATEYTAYQLLASNPFTTPVNYLAVPWTPLINKKILADMVPSITLDGGFTICQHIRYEQIIPILKKIGVSVLFTPHASRTKKYEGITVLPFPHFPKNGVNPAANKDILYSFVGVDWTHPVRKHFFSMSHPKNTVIIKRKKWHFWDSKQNIEHNAREYKDILARSRFALCPRGTGPSTIRFWEALQAGAIPILIADDMSLPEGIDWSSAIIRVAEHDIKKIPQIITSITPEEESSMKKACLQIHDKYFSGDNFVSSIRRYYDQEKKIVHGLKEIYYKKGEIDAK